MNVNIHTFYVITHKIEVPTVLENWRGPLGGGGGLVAKLYLATLWTARLLCPWDSPGKNTGVGCHFLLQRSFRRFQRRKRKTLLRIKSPLKMVRRNQFPQRWSRYGDSGTEGSWHERESVGLCLKKKRGRWILKFGWGSEIQFLWPNTKEEHLNTYRPKQIQK